MFFPLLFVAPPLTFDDPAPGYRHVAARASQLDPLARPHPEIEFVFEKDGKPQDVEHAAVDTRVAPKGRLVIWLMGYSAPLFERLSGYGLHAIQVHYANGWFGRFGEKAPKGDTTFLGRIRLEAATGENHSEVVDIPGPDGVAERARQLLLHLAKTDPAARWDYFLTDDRKDLRWERVILAGASHGSTTAARLAKHKRVDRVVMLCGPRDQRETWQALPSATQANRFFGFSHVLDGGWTGNHYPRSWTMLGLDPLGPLTNVDRAAPPYGHSHRLITDADVSGNADRAHSSVIPGGSAIKGPDGKFVHEDVWRYLFTAPFDGKGTP